MQSCWESHNGKRYYSARYCNLTSDQLREECDGVQSEMQSQPPNSVLLLCDARDSLISPDAIDMYKEHAKNSLPFLDRIAVLPPQGWKKFVVDVVLGFLRRDDVRVFDSEEVAREWLVS